MITREQVADLQPGDVVEMTDDRFPDVVTRGPLHQEDGSLYLGNFRCVRWEDGSLPSSGERCTITVVSRVPRPLYVNYPRTEPMPGDVVRDADKGPTHWPIWLRQVSRWAELNCDNSCTWRGPHELPARLRLLVDGETGQVVQP